MKTVLLFHPPLILPSTEYKHDYSPAFMRVWNIFISVYQLTILQLKFENSKSLWFIKGAGVV